MTLGLVVGKFYPPHKGHKLLIESARQQVDRLVVILAHHQSHKIPGEVRRAWLEKIHPDCEIHLVPDELENDSQAWATFTLAHLGRGPDIVFSSEDYGPEYARLMGAAHIMIDRQRSAVPVSGTLVRANPLAHLDDLEPCVRAWFVRRVVLIGAESTGKTTLAQMLAQTFQSQWVPEYGREHWEQKVAGLPMDGPLPGWTDDEFIHIAAEQQARENRLAGIANRVLICDTNAFATGTWYERYRGCRHERVDAIGRGDKVDLYLLTAPDVPFIQDGFRDGENIRHWMHDRFAEQLSQGEIPWKLLTGDYDCRLQAAAQSIAALLQQTADLDGMTEGG